MKLPLSWLKEFIDPEVDAEQLSHRLSVAGLEVESIEHFRPTFKGVVTAKVLNVERHPNADRLNLCEVDAAARGQYKIVCGAPNVRAGMVAPLALVGARLGGREKPGDAGATSLATVAPLEPAVIRGVRSEGMLCSQRELGFSDEHAGIMELDPDAPLGADFAEYLQLEDVVFDIAVLANRPDCLSIVGLAREVAALFEKPFKAPLFKSSRSRGGVDIAVEIQAPDLCPRYAALPMTEVKPGPSPMWMKRRLELCGMRSLGNLVDVTNYVMLELGQPLHAFDLGKLEGGKIIVRRAGADREFITLDNIKRELDANDLIIADGVKPVALAGVMGGLHSEVSDHTDSILLESAYFEPVTITRTSRRLGLRSESSYRFERGIDRAGQLNAIARAAALIAQLAGGKVSGNLVDLEPRSAPAREIELDLVRMAGLLGVEFAAPDVKRRLEALGFKTSSAGKGRLKATVPPFRPDISGAADLAEEVVRLRGLEEVPIQLPPRLAAYQPQTARRALSMRTREAMQGYGLTEVRNLAFCAPEENSQFAGIGGRPPMKVLNPLSAELSQLRASLVAGLLRNLTFNLNREALDFSAFEMGNVYYLDSDGRPAEAERLAAIGYGTLAGAGIGENGVAASFFAFKGILQSYFDAMGLAGQIQYERAEPATVPFLHPGKAATLRLNQQVLGYLGELHPAAALHMDLRASCAILELDFSYLIAYGSPRKTIELPPRFPSIRRDVAMLIDADVPAAEAIRTIRGIESIWLEKVEVFDAYRGERVPAGKKSLALSCRYRAKDRTLTDEEVNRAHAELVRVALERLGAELR